MHNKLLLLIIGGIVLAGAVYFLYRSFAPNEPVFEIPYEEIDSPELIDEEELVGENLYPDDNDRDGISNEEERTLGLDATNYDTDLDGLADSFELNISMTDPKNSDTDGDGIPDGREYLIFETNPNEADTDGDGFDDATEIDNGFNPNGEGTL